MKIKNYPDKNFNQLRTRTEIVTDEFICMNFSGHYHPKTPTYNAPYYLKLAYGKCEEQLKIPKPSKNTHNTYYITSEKVECVYIPSHYCIFPSRKF